MKRAAALVAVAAVGLAVTQPAEALSSWGGDILADNALVFPGWTGISNYTSDPYGVPDFKFWVNPFPAAPYPTMRIAGTFDEGTGVRYLNRVTFWYGSNTGSLWNTIVPGDLFIDLHSGTAGDGWDLFVDIKQDSARGDQSARNAGSSDVYSLPNWGYTLGGTAHNTDNPYYEQASNAAFQASTREPHPWGVEDDDKNGIPDFGTDTGHNAYWDGWKNWVNATTALNSYFDFGSGTSGLNLGTIASNITIGFTVTCANDVVYDGLGLPKEDIPEPGTVLLLGTGLLGILGMTGSRRRTRAA